MQREEDGIWLYLANGKTLRKHLCDFSEKIPHCDAPDTVFSP